MLGLNDISGGDFAPAAMVLKDLTAATLRRDLGDIGEGRGAMMGMMVVMVNERRGDLELMRLLSIEGGDGDVVNQRWG